jgi:hypothetical protein
MNSNMKKIFLLPVLLMLIIPAFGNEYDNSSFQAGFPSLFTYTAAKHSLKIKYGNFRLAPHRARLFQSDDKNGANSGEGQDEEKINKNPFKDIDTEWFKERYRTEKIFISVGAVTISVGFAVLLAGLINYFVTFDAQTNTTKTASYVLMGVGGGLNAAGLPFLLVGTIKLGAMKNSEKKKSPEK